MSFGNATRNFHLARSAYLDGSDLGTKKRELPPEQRRSTEADVDQREGVRAEQRRLAWTSRMSNAMDGAFGALSGTVGPSSEAPGLQDRRLLRSPRAADADAAGCCRPLSAPLPGGLVVDIDGKKHRRQVGPKSKPEKTLKRHDRHNGVKSTHKQADGDFQGRAFFDQIVQAEKYANLVGRSDKLPESSLPWAPEESWMTPSAVVPSLEARRGEEMPTVASEDLPTLLRSSRPQTSTEKDGREVVQPEVPEHLEKRSLKASVSRIAQESISFGRLLQEAQETLKVGAAPSARRLHQHLDALEAKTRQLRADANHARRSPREVPRQGRQSFDLITRGTGWRTQPRTSQL